MDVATLTASTLHYKYIARRNLYEQIHVYLEARSSPRRGALNPFQPASSPERIHNTGDATVLLNAYIRPTFLHCLSRSSRHMNSSGTVAFIAGFSGIFVQPFPSYQLQDAQAATLRVTATASSPRGIRNRSRAAGLERRHERLEIILTIPYSEGV